MVKGDIETATINSSSTIAGHQNIYYRQNNSVNNNGTNAVHTNGTSNAITTDAVNITDVSVECPLCMENLDIDDLDFYPCSCGYQVCRFCWHRLKNDENGLCPACRQPYPDSPIHFSSISIERVEELKKLKKKQKEKQKLKDSKQNLSTIRVVQKNLLFVIGIPPRFTQEELRKEFSKFGKIIKMVINATSAYVTYTRPEDAVAAIKTLNDSSQSHNNNNGIGGKIKNNNIQQTTNCGTNGSILTSVKASLGTTKYCTHWLRCQTCPKQPDCMYLHEIAEPEASFTKEEMQAGKHTEYEKRLIAHYLEVISLEKERQTMMQLQQLGSKQQQQTTQQQRPTHGVIANVGARSNSPTIMSNNYRKSSNHYGANNKITACDYDFNQFDHFNKKNQNYDADNGGDSDLLENLDNQSTAPATTSNNQMLDDQGWLKSTTNLEKSSSTVAIKISHNGKQNQAASNGNGNGVVSSINGHNSDSSSGNSSLSSTPNHHIVEPSIFSNFSSSSSSGTSLLSCDESSNSSSSSTPDNIQQAKQQKQQQRVQDDSMLMSVNSNGQNQDHHIAINHNNETINNHKEDVNNNDDDDDLDFDPISLSHRALEDMLRSSNTSSHGNNFGGNNLISNGLIQQNNNYVNRQQQVNVRENHSHNNQMGSSFFDLINEQSNTNMLNRLALLNLASESSGKLVPSESFNFLQQQLLNNTNNFGGPRSSPSHFQQTQLFNNNNGNQSALNQNVNLLSMMQQKHQQLDHLSQQTFDQKLSLGSSFGAFNNGQQQQQMFGYNGNNNPALSSAKLQQWQQQQNLRQLLPNVNIKFQQQNELNFNGQNQFLNNPIQNHSQRQMTQFWPSNVSSSASSGSSPSPSHQMAQQHQMLQQHQKMQQYFQLHQQRNNLNQYLLSQMFSSTNNGNHQMRQPPGFNDGRL